MAIARVEIVDRETPGFYHCTNRCVRRAFLCGKDDLTGQSFDHRKSWLEDRMLKLCDIFSIEIYAYAVMSNHYHIVLYLDPKAPEKWTDEQVADRWLQVYPSRLDRPENASQRNKKKSTIMNNPDLLKTYRLRLGDLSWFMRRLNEPLAKLSNQEDDCSGRFWEGRYTSQALLDEAAVLSCMAYVDLNPIRSNITKKLEDAHHTSIKKRLEKISRKNPEESLAQPINAVTGETNNRRLSITLKEYTELTEWAGRSIVHPDKASIPKDLATVLDRLNLQKHHWLKHIKNYDQHFCRVVGPIELIRQKAASLNKRSLKGISAASFLYLSSI